MERKEAMLTEAMEQSHVIQAVEIFGFGRVQEVIKRCVKNCKKEILGSGNTILFISAKLHPMFVCCSSSFFNVVLLTGLLCHLLNVSNTVHWQRVKMIRDVS